jgi:CubicO group peptidase (beta-lactamase class C family)
MNPVAPEQAGCSPERLGRISQLMHRYVDAGKIAGTVAMVFRRGHMAYARALGMMDVAAQKPMELDTLFRIYSMTKPITSVAALMLYEEGHFQLTDPVSRFIPAFGDAQVLVKATQSGPELAQLDREIAIWHLLTHTAGLAYGLDGEDPVDQLIQERVWRAHEKRPDTTLEELVHNLAGVPLAFQPGTAWRYSLATDVLGYLVQVVSGIPFEDFLRQRIFEPLGMVDTHFCVPEAKIDRFSVNYGPGEGGGLTPIDEPATSRFAKPTRCPSGGGGLVATAPDYVRFARMLLNRGELDGARLLGRKTVELMTMDHLGGDLHPFEDPEFGFGLGVSVLLDIARHRSLGSPGVYGWGGAASTTFWIDPREEMIGLLMLQFMPDDVYPINPEFRVAVYQSIV